MHTPSHVARRSLALAAMALLAAVATLTAAPASAVTNCSPSSSWGTNRPDLAAQVIGLINQYRAGKGLSQLAVSGPLTASSEWKSLHMAANGYFDHNDPAPVSRTAFQRATDCGYSGGWWGENIAWGYTTSQSVVDGWLGSPGHKANIENANFTSTGVGVAANASGQLYWTRTSAPTSPAARRLNLRRRLHRHRARHRRHRDPSVQSASTTTTTSEATQSTVPAGTTASQPPAAALRVGARPAHVTRSKRRSRLAALVPFVQMATGRPVTTGSVRCRAEVEGRRLRVVANVFEAKLARCAWRVPAWAKGKRLTGVVAVQNGGTAATRLFIRTLP